MNTLAHIPPRSHRPPGNSGTRHTQNERAGARREGERAGGRDREGGRGRERKREKRLYFATASRHARVHLSEIRIVKDMVIAHPPLAPERVRPAEQQERSDRLPLRARLRRHHQCDAVVVCAAVRGHPLFAGGLGRLYRRLTGGEGLVAIRVAKQILRYTKHLV